MARRRPGECRLCGTQAAALEEEDVFPTWARNQLRSELAESPVGGQWPARVVLRACAECNLGLGREFEEPAASILKPLARGEVRTLDRDEMAVVARWAWLKDIEYVLGRPVLWTQQEGRSALTESSLTYWRGNLAQLRATGRPPRGYVVRLAIIGSPNDALTFEPFTPEGWRQEHAFLTSHNSIGLLIVQSILTNRENAAEFVRSTRTESRATLIWPPLQKMVTVGARTVPLNHSHLWRDEQNFHPESGWGGGWRIRVPRGT